MSSNDSINSDENVSVGLPVTEMQKECKNLTSFARLMHLFLSANIREWNQRADRLPLYNLDACGELKGELQQLNKSILVLAFLLRRKFWKLFRENSEHLRSGGDEKYVLFLSIPYRHYMLHFLVHLACLYEMVRFGHRKGKNYVERAMSDLTVSIDPRALLCFVKQGGFEKLYTAARNINAFYDALVTPLDVRFPYTDALTPFVRAVNIMERRLRSIEWDKYLKEKNNSEEDQKCKRKLQALLEFESQGYRIGYVGVNKNLSRDEDNTSNTAFQTMHTSTVDDSSFATLDETDIKGNDEILAPSSSSNKHMDTAQNGATSTIPYETPLIVSENFREKYIRSNKGELEFNCKRDIKIYCPEKKTEVAIFSMKTFDDNIQECKWDKVMKGMYVFDIERFYKLANDEIIMDTSSEEEDELDMNQESIKSQAMNFFRDLTLYEMRAMKFLLKWYRRKNLFKFLYTLVPKEESTEGRTGAIPEAKTPIQRNRGSSANGTGAIPKAKTPIQRKPGSSANGTGAIPKAKTPSQMKPWSSVRSTGAIPKANTPFQWMPGSSANAQNAPISSHSSNSPMTSLRRISMRGSWHTPDVKRELRKKPMKRT